MGQTYSQLTQQERYGLEIMRKQGQTLRDIAKVMGRSHTTLSRELPRNTGQRGDRHHQAQGFADQRPPTKPKAVKVTEPGGSTFRRNSKPGGARNKFVGGSSQSPLVP